MIFKGIIQAILPPRTGISQKSGKEWKTQQFVVRDDTQKYPETFVFEVFNKEIGAAAGDSVEVRFEGDAHEYNGKWYNSLRAYEVIRLIPMVQPTPVVNDTPTPKQEEDQLPF